MLVNGEFPGPMIEANWGDTIQVTVHNNITGPEEGAAIHWHGFLQVGTPWEDGTPAVSQCPIAPMKSFTYQFQAHLYGTSWYHSHYSAQYAGGLLGQIVIHGPSQLHYDVDIGPIMLSDWYHDDYMAVLETILKTDSTPRVSSDNNLINGKSAVDCSNKKSPCTSGKSFAQFRFQQGKVHRMRLINSGAEATQRFSLDGHVLTVIANDFVPVEPYDTEVVTLAVGQRTDVLVKANAGLKDASFWMRSNISICSQGHQRHGLAAVYYDQANEAESPNSAPWDVPDPFTCSNDELSLTKPVHKIPLPSTSYAHTMNVELYVNESGIMTWKFDNVSFRGNYNAPTLLLANLGNTSFPEEWAVRNLYTNTSVRVNVTNKTPAQ